LLLKEENKMTVVNLEDYYYDSERCPKCNNCKWVDFIYTPGVKFSRICPSVTNNNFEAYAAHGRLHLARCLLEGKIDYSPTLLEIIYKCNLCGACDIRCKRNLDLEILSTLEGLREKCVRDGQGPLPAHKKVGDNIEKSKNRYGGDPKGRLKWLPSDIKVADKADMMYFVGCAASYRRHEISKSTARILEASKQEFMLMDEEWCCGHPLNVVGDRDYAIKLAERNIEVLKKSGASTVVTSCAECYHSWKVEYPKIFKKNTEDMGYKVLHITELVDNLMNEGKLKLSHSVDMKVSYHDSCYLARLSEPWIHWEGTHGKFGMNIPPKEFRKGQNGVYKAPRNILKSISGIDLVEMKRIRENTWCCGAGGGVQDAYPDFALWTAGERLEEVNAVGTEAIVSSCPYCKENFGKAAKERNDNIKCYDITEVVARAILGKEVK
jgi:Fe-S oxidoreductase